MNNFLLQRKRGLSAVELVIYVGVLSLVLGVFFVVMFALFQTFSSVRATRALITTAQGGFERVLREGRAASAVDEENSDLGVSTSVVVFLDEADASTTFYVDGGVLMVLEEGGSALPLTPDGVVVDSFTAALHEGTHSDALSLSLALHDARGSGALTTFNSTIVLRGSYE